MGIPLISEIQEILEDFEIRMRRILEGAWQEWMEVENKSTYSTRTRASLVFDLIRRRALDEFHGDPNIRAIPKGQTVHFLFRDRVLLRFKKANSAGIGSNIETQAVIEFTDPQVPLIELPEIFHVEACYHLDKLATKMALLTISARQRNTRIWSYEMRRPPVADVIPLPSSPRPDDGSPVVVRVRNPAEKSETRGE